MFWMKIDVCPELYAAPSLTHVLDLQVKVTDFLCLSLVLKFLRSLYIIKVFSRVDVWHDDRYWSKVLFCTTPTHGCDLRSRSHTF